MSTPKRDLKALQDRFNTDGEDLDEYAGEDEDEDVDEELEV
jgi:hypothetical protein